MKLLVRSLISIAIAIMIGWLLYSLIKSNENKTVTTHRQVVEKIEAIGRLELVRMNIRDVVEHKYVRQWLPNASALLIIEGEAVGCIDLQQVKAENVDIKKDTLRIKLPSPMLCYCKIDHKKSKVYETKYDYFVDTNLVEDAFREAEKQLEKTALESGILEQTKQNADRLLKPFFMALGFKYVEISF